MYISKKELELISDFLQEEKVLPFELSNKTLRVACKWNIDEIEHHKLIFIKSVLLAHFPQAKTIQFSPFPKWANKLFDLGADGMLDLEEEKIDYSCYFCNKSKKKFTIFGSSTSIVFSSFKRVCQSCATRLNNLAKFNASGVHCHICESLTRGQTFVQENEKIICSNCLATALDELYS